MIETGVWNKEGRDTQLTGKKEEDIEVEEMKGVRETERKITDGIGGK